MSKLNTVDFLFIFIAICVFAFLVREFCFDKKKVLSKKALVKKIKKDFAKTIEEKNDLMENIIEISKQSEAFIKNILVNYYAGDFDKLDKMVSKSLLKTLVEERESHLKNKEIREFIEIDNLSIIKKNNKNLELDFTSLQVVYKTDKDGNIKEGFKNKFIKIRDLWKINKTNDKHWILEEVLEPIN